MSQKRRRLPTHLTREELTLLAAKLLLVVWGAWAVTTGELVFRNATWHLQTWARVVIGCMCTAFIAYEVVVLTRQRCRARQAA